MNATHQYERASDLPADLAEITLQWIFSLADTKLRLGLQFSQWVTGTPALEAAVGSAAITQDELGHARGLFTLLRTFPNAPEGLDASNDLEARSVFYAPPALTPRWESWLNVVAASVIFDRALHLTVEATIDSSFTPLASLAGKIVQEEAFHRVYGDTWFARLAKENDRIRTQLQRSIDWAWQLTTIWLGPPDQPEAERLVQAGLLKQTASQMREHWLQQLMPLIEQNNLMLPTSIPDWTGWDAKFRACI